MCITSTKCILLIRNVFVWTIEDFKKMRAKFEIVICWTYIGDFCQCSSILGSLQAPRGLWSCRRRFFILKQHTPWFLEHVSCGCCQFSSILGSLQAPRGLWSCRRRFCFSQKNTPLEFGSMYLVDVVDLLSILGSLPPSRGLCASCRGFFFSKKHPFFSKNC